MIRYVILLFDVIQFIAVLTLTSLSYDGKTKTAKK